jgi:hypothetical protein
MSASDINSGLLERNSHIRSRRGVLQLMQDFIHVVGASVLPDLVGARSRHGGDGLRNKAALIRTATTR